MAGTTTRQTFSLTHGDAFLPSDREKKLVHLLCQALQTRFKDATQDVEATSVADFKIWPLDNAELEGFVYTSL